MRSPGASADPDRCVVALFEEDDGTLTAIASRIIISPGRHADARGHFLHGPVTIHAGVLGIALGLPVAAAAWAKFDVLDWRVLPWRLDPEAALAAMMRYMDDAVDARRARKRLAFGWRVIDRPRQLREATAGVVEDHRDDAGDLGEEVDVDFCEDCGRPGSLTQMKPRGGTPNGPVLCAACAERRGFVDGDQEAR